ncbi:MAG: hypothetical protein PSV24_12545 [Rhodoferax sp.]|nr:hypothetical protein [Rhodoferax sp.]
MTQKTASLSRRTRQFAAGGADRHAERCLGPSGEDHHALRLATPGCLWRPDSGYHPA